MNYSSSPYPTVRRQKPTCCLCDETYDKRCFGCGNSYCSLHTDKNIVSFDNREQCLNCIENIYTDVKQILISNNRLVEK